MSDALRHQHQVEPGNHFTWDPTDGYGTVRCDAMSVPTFVKNPADVVNTPMQIGSGQPEFAVAVYNTIKNILLLFIENKTLVPVARQRIYVEHCGLAIAIDSVTQLGGIMIPILGQEGMEFYYLIPQDPTKQKLLPYPRLVSVIHEIAVSRGCTLEQLGKLLCYQDGQPVIG